MIIKELTLKNFTAFDDLKIQFSDNINIFTGLNGTGKTHIMKILYSACQAADKRILFSQKLAKCFLPYDYKISNLINIRNYDSKTSIDIVGKSGNNASSIKISFNNKTSKWNANTIGEEKWEKEFDGAISIFIPTGEILSNSYNLFEATNKNSVNFDDTYLDIINSAKVDISTEDYIEKNRKMTNKIEELINGKVCFDMRKDQFYIKNNHSMIEFSLASEGIKKFALVWQLIRNGYFKKGSVLFWDEPEACINPLHIRLLADILLTLQQNGVQVFITTYNFMLANIIDALSYRYDCTRFFSFYKEDGFVKYDVNNHFNTLGHNSIKEGFEEVLDRNF